ncbi:MAG: hypothetical protein JNK14_06840 [Chitinophagaceae bacterium]|nr:hypothetical protein [Chitinophagaceae bacterium]
MQKPLLYIIFCLLPVALFGQEEKRFTFTHFNSSSGLASNQVHDIVQDENGYLWIATTDGLQRYDGIRYKLFRHDDNDPGSLPVNGVVQLLMDSNKNLWILLSNGKTGIFDTRRLSFREAPIQPKNPLSLRSSIKRLIKDEYGHVFLLLAGWEVLTWSNEKNEFSPAHNFFLQNKEWRIADFVPQPGTQNYWISIQGGGIAVYNHATRRLSYAGNNADNIAAIDRFEGKLNPYNFYFDKKGRFWCCNWQNGTPFVYAYDLVKNEFAVDGYSLFPFLQTYFEVRGFFEQQDGTVWIRGVMVLARFLEKEKQFQHVFNGYGNEKDMAFRIVTSLIEDNEHNIWAGTGNNGLFRFNPAREFFTNVPHKNRTTGQKGDGSPLSFARDKDGTILVGHWGDGLYRFDKNYEPVPVGIKGIADKNFASVWDMYISRHSDTIWMASQPGFFIYDQQRRSAAYYNPASLQNRTVREIAEDDQGNAWFGMQGIGLFRLNAGDIKAGRMEAATKFAAIPDVQVNKIIVDRKGYVWVATSVEGAYMIDPATNKVVTHFHNKAAPAIKLPEEGVSSILDYNDSLVVLTTTTRILLYNRIGQKLTTIGRSENISGSITSTEKDKTGHVWISTNSALYRLNIFKKIFVSFNRNDGMTNDYFILSSSYTSPDGTMLFGTSAQFVAFDPLAIPVNANHFPKVMITDFRVMNRSLMVDSVLRLDNVDLATDENSLEIEFSYLKYIKDHAIRYKLEGLDKNWKIADEDHRATYSYLPPGHYTFIATTLNVEGNPGPNETRLKIYIRPPFWKTWWFFCLLALLIAAVFYWLDRQRLNKLNALQKVRAEIAGNLHEEVNTTLNNISLLSEMARIKADKDAERSKEYIAQISTKSQNMIHAMDDILWSIDPENDTMEKSLLRMMEYADSLKNLYGASIEIALDKKVRSLTPDMKTRHEILLIFKKALGMIVQLAGGRNTLAHIDLFKSRISVKLQDTSAAFDKNTVEIEEAIRDMHTRAAEIGADLDIQCSTDGVAVILLVPVK